MSGSRFLTRVVISNYKSIASCDVELQPLTFLVGPNGAGKSNFLDALRFVADALRTTLDHAMRDRGGIREVRRRTSGHPTHFGLRLEFVLDEPVSGHYAFRIGALSRGGYEVQDEECFVYEADKSTPAAYFHVHSGGVDTSSRVTPAPATDRLYLVSASGTKPYRAVFDAFSQIGSYNFSPEVMRVPQPPDSGDLLARDGWNIASVIHKMQTLNDPGLSRIQEYLAAVVPGIRSFEAKDTAGQGVLEFLQASDESSPIRRFRATNMSDGTLRALGVLVALYHPLTESGKSVRLIGLEEPEAGLHPAAAGILRDCLIEASKMRQVIVTSHSPDLLDDKELDASTILAVVNDRMETQIGPLNAVSRGVLRDQLYTPGELLRMNQLNPDVSRSNDSRAKERLFDPTIAR